MHALADDHAAQAAGLLATSYRLAAGLSGCLGLVDLAAHAAHRALDTTRPELDEAAALRYLAWVLVRQGDLAEAERLAVRAAERLDGGLLAQLAGDRIGVFGSLLFNAASAAARQGSPGRADDLLRAASATAARSGVDRVDETGVFGPRVAAMQAPQWSRAPGYAVDLRFRPRRQIPGQHRSASGQHADQRLLPRQRSSASRCQNRANP